MYLCLTIRCGSTIVSHNWLLTAAHCIASNTGTLVSVLARAGTISSNTGGQTIMASLAIPHPSKTGIKHREYVLYIVKIFTDE